MMDNELVGRLEAVDAQLAAIRESQMETERMIKEIVDGMVPLVQKVQSGGIMSLFGMG